MDDQLTEGLERLKVTIIPQNPGLGDQAGDNYHVDNANNNATLNIVDDTDATRGAESYYDGPYVKLILTDSLGNALATPAAASIMENGGKVYYQVQLVDRSTGNPYTALQDVTINLKATGLGTAVLNGAGTDYGFTSTGTGYSYNPATGVISITIPTGQKTAAFTGTAVGDNRAEGNEQVTVEITSVTNNEASVHPTVNTTTATIIDVPAVSVTVSAPEIYESNAVNTLGDAGASLPNTTTFTFTLSSASLDPITVPLNWATGTSAGMTNQDYTYSLDGGVTFKPLGTNLPASITFPAGTTSVTIKVMAADDSHSEINEILRVTLKPESGAAYAASHKYYVTTDPAKAAAGVTIIDDDNAPGQPDLDGPVLALYVLDSGSPVDTRTASVWEEAPIKTPAGGHPTGQISYRIQLLDHSGNAYSASRDASDGITVTLNLTGISTATYGSTVGTGDYYLTPSQFAPGVFQSFTPSNDGKGGVLVLKISPTSSYVDIPVNVVADRSTETGRIEYTTDGDGNIVANPIPDEGFSITIADTTGNESSVHASKNYVNTTTLEEFIETQVCIEKDHNGDVLEGQVAGYKIYLTQVTDEDVTVYVQVSSANPEDLESRLFEVTIPKGSLSAPLNVTIFNDTFSEGVESYNLEILGVKGGEAIINENRKSVTGTMKDDMNGPVVSISGDSTVHESPDYPGGGNGKATYTVTLADSPKTANDTHAPSEDMYITLKLEGITASVSGADADVKFALNNAGFNFSDPHVSLDRINGDGTVRIKIAGGAGGFGQGDSGSSSFTFTVDVTDDALSEGRESFKVSITGVEGSEATVGVASKTTEIVDDTEDGAQYLDGPFIHLTGETVVSEAQSEASYTLTLRDASGNIIPAGRYFRM